MKLKKIGVLSSGINTAIYAALLGLLVGVMFALVSLLGAGFGGEGAGAMAGMGVFAAILFPIFYGAAGFVGGVIGAFFMNLAFRITGGLELHLE
jgi:hypothetical protein